MVGHRTGGKQLSHWRGICWSKFLRGIFKKSLTKKKENANFSSRQHACESDCVRDHGQRHLHFLEILLKYAVGLLAQSRPKEGGGSKGRSGEHGLDTASQAEPF